MIAPLLAAVTFAQVVTMMTQVRDGLGLQEPLEVAEWGFSGDFSDGFYAWVEPRRIEAGNTTGYRITVTQRLMRGSRRAAFKHLVHEGCHILNDPDVIDRWGSISQDERESRHRTVERCVDWFLKH